MRKAKADGEKVKYLFFMMVVAALCMYPFIATWLELNSGREVFRVIDEGYSIQGKKFNYENYPAETKKVSPDELEQTFTSIFDQVTEIRLPVRKRMSVKDGNYQIKLTNAQSGVEVYRWTVSATDVTDDRELQLVLNEPGKSSESSMKGQKYQLSIKWKGDAQESKPMKFIIYQKDAVPGGNLTIGEKTYDKDLAFMVTGQMRVSMEYVTLWLRVYFSVIGLLLLFFLGKRS